jgi:hypothetical protein
MIAISGNSKNSIAMLPEQSRERLPIGIYTNGMALEPCRYKPCPEVAVGNAAVWQGFKAEARRVRIVIMHSRIISLSLALLLCIGFVPMQAYAASGRDASDIVISFTNGPDENDSVTGTHTLQFSTSGSGTLANMTIELNDGSDWVGLTTLSSSPWVYFWDSTDVDNGTYRLRAWGNDSLAGEDSSYGYSGNFTIANQVPVISNFSLADVVVGDGSSPSNRAWTTTPANGSLIFSWAGSDDDLSYASLVNVPGPGTPANDGPGSFDYSWNWTNGNLEEGKWGPQLSLYDSSGLSANQAMYIGIDRSGPSVGTPSVSTNGWVNSNSVELTGLSSGASDSGGSGIDHYEVKVGFGEWTTAGSSGTASLSLSEGQHTIHVRSVDRVGNAGSSKSTEVGVDLTIPLLGGWSVPELNTSRIGAVSISYIAADPLSGISESDCLIQYGFDSDGVGSTPDITGRWLSMTAGLEGTVGLTDWSTKSRQYLMLRATVVDNASNSILTENAGFQVLPGLDITWNSSAMNIDRIMVRPGTSDVSTVMLTSQIITNEAYGGSLTVRLEAAPADRTAEVSWTTVETRILLAGELSDSEEILYWNHTIEAPGQWDLRLVIDPNDLIDEKDEGDNAHYFVVTGVNTNFLDVVSGFMPTLGWLMVAGFAVAWLSRRRYSSSQEIDSSSANESADATSSLSSGSI